MNHLWVLGLALVADGLIGDPPAVWRRLPHPVTGFGALIEAADRHLNRETWAAGVRRGTGLLTVLGIVAVAAAIGIALEAFLAGVPYGFVGTIAIAAVFLASRSLFDHVRNVADAMDTGLPEARAAVAHIVGRDPMSLDAPAVARATIESLAENFSDGVVAPAFWFALLGLPGLLVYKALNTADSMIGHRSTRHIDFGWAAARLDDLANLVPARLAGAAIVVAAPLVGGRPGDALRVMRSEARHHRSPNAGWPEAAMAGALGLALAGPRTYASGVVDDPFLNASGRRLPGSPYIRRALGVYLGANGVLLALVVVAAVVIDHL